MFAYEKTELIILIFSVVPTVKNERSECKVVANLTANIVS